MGSSETFSDDLCVMKSIMSCLLCLCCMYYMGYKLINKYAQFLYCHSEVNNGGNRTDTRRLLSGR